MGKLEKRNKERMRRTKLNKALIGVVAVAGVLAVAVAAPGVMGALGKMKLIPQDRYRVKTTLGRMVKRGYMKVEVKGGKKVVSLTEKGERFASLMGEGKLRPAKPKRWDNKWRMVAYDLQGNATALRARIRELLRSWGFVMLQQSVWIFPYDCEDLVGLLKEEFHLGKKLLYIIADEIENDSFLRDHFHLPKE